MRLWLILRTWLHSVASAVAESTADEIPGGILDGVNPIFTVAAARYPHCSRYFREVWRCEHCGNLHDSIREQDAFDDAYARWRAGTGPHPNASLSGGRREFVPNTPTEIVGIVPASQVRRPAEAATPQLPIETQVKDWPVSDNPAQPMNTAVK